MIKHSIGYVKAIAKERGYKCNSEIYKNRNGKMEWECPVGHCWDTSFVSFRNGGCPHCSGCPPQTIEDAKKFAIKKNGLCLSGEYKNAREPLLWKCFCGYKWFSNWDNIKNKGKWCPSCARRPSIKIEEVIEYAKKNKGKLLSDVYVNSSSLLDWGCCVCGNIWSANYNNVKNKNSWCPSCSSGKTQKYLFDIIKIIFKNKKVYYNFRNFPWLKHHVRTSLELDFYLPHIKLAIEYDGHQHFFPVDFFGGREEFTRNKNCDFVKNKLIFQNSNDVKYFIRIPYWERISKENVIKILERNGISF